MTVQVKTVSPSIEGKFLFPCPTSLFAYAERTLDVVLLMAVDHSEQLVLWKYISRKLIHDNLQKQEQETITIHFNSEERLSVSNVKITINKWKTLFLLQRNIIECVDDIKAENEKLRQQLVHAEFSNFTIQKNNVIEIQKFSDTYNNLLDVELNYVKRICYPSVWKRGVALFTTPNNELRYALYSIKYGENSLLLKQLNRDDIKFTKFDTLFFLYNSNIYAIVKKIISTDIAQMFKNFRSIPQYDNYVIEYLQETIFYYSYVLELPMYILKDYNALKNVIAQRIAYKKGNRSNCKNVNLELLYECTEYLLNRGYDGYVELYPRQGDYGETGTCSDSFTPELAFQKTKIVFQYVYATYMDFIKNNFPLIMNELDMYFKADFVLVNLEYATEWPYISIYYFYCIDGTKGNNKTKVEFSLHKQHELFNRYPIFLVEKCISYNGHTYECTKSNGIDIHKVLFGKTCLIDTFYEIFKTRLEHYVNSM